MKDAGAMVRAEASKAIEQAACWDGSGQPPATVIGASPGVGKTRSMLEAIAAFDLSRLDGDAVFYAPSHEKADEAAREAEQLGAGWHVTRGRSAVDPKTGRPMCARSKLAERAARIGLNVTKTLCRREDAGGRIHYCPHRMSCPYWSQWEGLGDAPVLRFESHAYLPTQVGPDPSLRKIGLRIVDEKSWHGSLRSAEVRAKTLLRPRVAEADSDKRMDAPADIGPARLQAGRALLEALRRGDSAVAAVSRFGVEGLKAFARAERAVRRDYRAAPDADDALHANALERAERVDHEASATAQLWDILADCLRRGLDRTDRIELLPEHRRIGGNEGPDEVIRLHWLADADRTVPEIHLDADADPVIVERVLPGAILRQVLVQPNADVIQISDRTLSNRSLQRDNTRRDVAALVAAEAFSDNKRGGSGTLAVATKKIVRAMFEDAGLIAPQTDREHAARIMRETELHGARWAWFGPGLLGLNAYEHITTVVVIGREEMPLDALESQGRAMFGDHGEPLEFVLADEEGGRLVPEVSLSYTMAHGSGRKVAARAHPDPRIRSLQRQGREANTRQAIERLRLGRSEVRKRVVIACKVPVPNLPVTALTTWHELVPGRIEQALVEAGGLLRLSAAGLSTDAPHAFPTEKAAKEFMQRTRKRFPIGLTPLIGSYYRCESLFAVEASIRGEGKRGPETPCLLAGGEDILSADECDLRNAAEAKWGPLTAFRITGRSRARPA